MFSDSHSIQTQLLIPGTKIRLRALGEPTTDGEEDEDDAKEDEEDDI